MYHRNKTIGLIDQDIDLLSDLNKSNHLHDYTAVSTQRRKVDQFRIVFHDIDGNPVTINTINELVITVENDEVIQGHHPVSKRIPAGKLLSDPPYAVDAGVKAYLVIDLLAMAIDTLNNDGHGDGAWLSNLCFILSTLVRNHTGGKKLTDTECDIIATYFYNRLLTFDKTVSKRPCVSHRAKDIELNALMRYLAGEKTLSALDVWFTQSLPAVAAMDTLIASLSQQDYQGVAGCIYPLSLKADMTVSEGWVPLRSLIDVAKTRQLSPRFWQTLTAVLGRIFEHDYQQDRQGWRHPPVGSVTIHHALNRIQQTVSR